MGSEHHDSIARRIGAALGADWEIGIVDVTGDLTWVAPRRAVDPGKRDFLTISWDATEDSNVAQGLGKVLALGEFNRRSFDDVGTLDEVVEKLRTQVPVLLAKRRGLFG